MKTELDNGKSQATITDCAISPWKCAQSFADGVCLWMAEEVGC